MDTDLINVISSLSENVHELNMSVQSISTTQWWNTQWFSTVIGAGTGLISTFIFSTIKNRNKRLFDYYQWFLEQGTFSDPQGLLATAIHVVYGGGKEDKPLGEKMVIELRSHTKYWYEPVGKFRFLMWSYEKAVLKIKDGTKEEVKKQLEYKDAEKKFKKVMDFVYKRTGENEWTS